MKTFEIATMQQLKFETAIGSAKSYGDKRLSTIVQTYNRVENFLKKPKTSVIDGQTLTSSGSLTAPYISYDENGIRKLTHECRPVNPLRYNNEIAELRLIDNVITGQALLAVDGDFDKLAKSKFIGLNVQLQGDTSDLHICPIKHIDFKTFKGEDLKTRPFDEPDNPDNINTQILDSEKIWAIMQYCVETVKQIGNQNPKFNFIRHRPLVEKLVFRMRNAFFLDLDPERFDRLTLPKKDGKYDVEIWPKPTDADFRYFIEELMPSIRDDPDLKFLEGNNQLSVL